MPKTTRQSARGKKGIEAWAVYHKVQGDYYIGTGELLFHWLDTMTIFETAQEANDYIVENVGRWSRNLKSKVVPVLITPLPTPRRKGRVSKKKR